MAKDVESVGSDKAEMKKLLKVAKAQPIHMAFGTGADGKVVIQMHKLKPPRTLEKGLKDAVEGGKNYRFGTVMVDPDAPKVAKFVVNKASGGIARKLVIALKGTGFKKIQIVTESGEALEEAESEDDEDEDEDDADDADEELDVRPSYRRADDDDEAATLRRDGRSNEDDEPVGEQEAPVAFTNPDEYEQPSRRGDENDDANGAPSAKALTRDLTGLVKQMLGIIRNEPSAKDALAELATEAQVNLKRGDLEQAAAGIEILRTAIDAYADDIAESNEAADGESALDGETAGDSDDVAAAEEPANGKGGKAAVQKFHKSRVAWTATRAKVDTELQKLSKAIMEASAGEDMIDGLEDQFFKVVDPVLAELDESLSDTLAAAADADGAEREELLDDARKTIARYKKFVESNSIISDLDNNPFVTLAIGKTLTSTLTTLTSIMR